LTEEELDRTLWRTRFGRDYGPVLRQTPEQTTFVEMFLLQGVIFNIHRHKNIKIRN